MSTQLERPCETGQEECVRVYWYTMSIQSGTPSQAREEDEASVHRAHGRRSEGTSSQESGQGGSRVECVAVHYEQTVRPGVWRHTMSKQSGPAAPAPIPAAAPQCMGAS